MDELRALRRQRTGEARRGLPGRGGGGSLGGRSLRERPVCWKVFFAGKELPFASSGHSANALGTLPGTRGGAHGVSALPVRRGPEWVAKG